MRTDWGEKETARLEKIRTEYERRVENFLARLDETISRSKKEDREFMARLSKEYGREE